VAIWLARQYSGLSFDKIAEFFGGRDPATIRHAIRQIDIRRISDPVLEEQLATLILKLV
jgi:chromosomal replication initiation ATPase DnaA